MEDEEAVAQLMILATILVGELEDEAQEQAILAAHAFVNESSQKRIDRKLRKRKAFLDPSASPIPRGKRRPAGTGKRQARGRTYIRDQDEVVNYHHETGLLARQFDELLTLMTPHLAQGRSTDERTAKGISRSLTVHSRLFMTLHWLRHYPSYELLARQFRVSVATVSRELRDTVLKLFIHLPALDWPQGPQPTYFAGASGAVDCTTHLRWRVHPWSTEFYRGDAHAHFINSQQVCSLVGKIWDVQFALGHNNDQGIFTDTAVGDELRQRNLTLLGDGAYHDPRVLLPTDQPDVPHWAKQHSGFRSVVEQNFALIHFWKASSGVFRQDPEFQEMCIAVIYKLVAFKYRDQPLRSLTPENQ